MPREEGGNAVRLYVRVLGGLLALVASTSLTIWLVAELSFRSGSEPQAAMRLSVLIGTAVALLCAVLLATIVTMSIIRPLRRLTALVRGLSNAGEMSPP